MPEGLPSAPGDIRAFNVHTGTQRWAFHTIPHPGELGYDTWPKDAWQYSGGANAWAGLSLDAKRGLVFAVDRIGRLRLLRREPSRRQPVREHDPLPARGDGRARLALPGRQARHLGSRLPGAALARDDHAATAGRVDVVAQIAKNGRTYVLDRETGRAGLPDARRSTRPPPTCRASSSAATQVLPTLPPPFTRQRFTEDLITTRTPEAARPCGGSGASCARRRVRPAEHAGHHPVPRDGRRRRVGRHRVRPDVGSAVRQRQRDGLDGEAGRAEDARRQAGDGARTLYQRHCASCHRADLRGNPPEFPSLVGHRRAQEHRRSRRPSSATAADACPATQSCTAPSRRAMVQYIVSGASETVRARPTVALRRPLHARRGTSASPIRTGSRPSRRPGAR